MDPIVKEMLEKVHQTDLDLDIRLFEEMQKLPPCEGLYHSTDDRCHNPSAPAAFWVIAPCGLDLMICAQWVQYGSIAEATNCSCGAIHRSAEYTYIPLNLQG